MKKVVLLTGGTGKFGRILAQYFVLNGWTVVITSRGSSGSQEPMLEMPDFQNTMISLTVDMSKPDASRGIVEELSTRNITVTHLINNARSLSTLAVQEDGTTSRDNFIGEFAMDVVVPYELTMGLAQSTNHALQTVVNIGSMYGEVAPNPALYGGTLEQSPVQYGVSKAALHHLTRELAIRLAPQKIRVNCVAFGGVEGRVDEEFRSRYASLVPSRRMLTENEIIGPIDFLINETSSSINGHILVADGGWSAW